MYVVFLIWVQNYNIFRQYLYSFLLFVCSYFPLKLFCQARLTETASLMAIAWCGNNDYANIFLMWGYTYNSATVHPPNHQEKGESGLWLIYHIYRISVWRNLFT